MKFYDSRKTILVVSQYFWPEEFRVNELVIGFQEKGYKTVQWTGLDQKGIKVSSGIYFYRLQSDDYMATKKMILLK